MSQASRSAEPRSSSRSGVSSETAIPRPLLNLPAMSIVVSRIRFRMRDHSPARHRRTADAVTDCVFRVAQVEPAKVDGYCCRPVSRFKYGVGEWQVGLCVPLLELLDGLSCERIVPASIAARAVAIDSAARSAAPGHVRTCCGGCRTKTSRRLFARARGPHRRTPSHRAGRCRAGAPQASAGPARRKRVDAPGRPDAATACPLAPLR